LTNGEVGKSVKTVGVYLVGEQGVRIGISPVFLLHHSLFNLSLPQCLLFLSSLEVSSIFKCLDWNYNQNRKARRNSLKFMIGISKMVIGCKEVGVGRGYLLSETGSAMGH
jgi:hypothetical protein